MISENEFLQTEIQMGITPDNPSFVELAKQTALSVINEIEFTTVMDYGAGVGVYANELSKLGKDVVVYEKFKPHRDFIMSRFKHLPIYIYPITTDLMYFIEVAEHMTDEELLSLFSEISPSYILFSSTSQVTDNDEAWGHINIKTQEEWIELFDKLGYELLKQMSLPTEWTKLFKRK